MEDHRPKDAATCDAEFEFGCITPGSPTNYLADQLFSNGKFVLHDFPIQPRKSTSPNLSNISRSVSRTSSISSKDSLSLMSSRSNSTNSSSSCSSARTSTSEAPSERKLLNPAKSAGNLRNPARNNRCASGQFRTAKQHGPPYNYSQRWQFIAPVPVLNHQTSSSSSRRKNAREGERPDKKEKKKKPAAEGLCRRFFRWFVSTCKECHAMEPSRKGSVFKENMNFH